MIKKMNHRKMRLLKIKKNLKIRIKIRIYKKITKKKKIKIKKNPLQNKIFNNNNNK